MGFINYLQLFGIGVSFGFAGPCFFSCTPLLIAYLAGKNIKWSQGLKEMLAFFCARLLAYLVLGCLAALSAVLLKRFGSSEFMLLLKPAGGVIIILFGVLILFNRWPAYCGCGFSVNKTFTFSSLFILGFISGISPCAPLMALLFEITVISKTVIEGLLCAFSFGLGTFISGFLIVAGLSRIVCCIPGKILKSEFSKLIFRIICALLLIILGMGFILA